MDFGFGSRYDTCSGYNPSKGQSALLRNAAAQPRTLREQLTEQIAYHTAKIKDLTAAREALTPDVEKALDAFRKLA